MTGRLRPPFWPGLWPCGPPIEERAAEMGDNRRTWKGLGDCCEGEGCKYAGKEECWKADVGGLRYACEDEGLIP